MKKYYPEFIGKLLTQNHAVPLPESRIVQQDDNVEVNQIWYQPHFGIYHPKKPTQIRGVFDSSAQYKGTSQNKELLSGPDVLNSLHRILIHFRQETIGVTCDLEQMFHCFYVSPNRRDDRCKQNYLTSLQRQKCNAKSI